MTICLNCKKEFEESRTDTKFCSPKCRKEAFLNKRSEHPHQERLIGTDKIESPYAKSEREKTERTLKHLEETPLEKLRKEGCWIPNWRKEFKTKHEAQIYLLKNLYPGRYQFLGYDLRLDKK